MNGPTHDPYYVWPRHIGTEVQYVIIDRRTQQAQVRCLSHAHALSLAVELNAWVTERETT